MVISRPTWFFIKRVMCWKAVKNLQVPIWNFLLNQIWKITEKGISSLCAFTSCWVHIPHFGKQIIRLLYCLSPLIQVCSHVCNLSDCENQSHIFKNAQIQKGARMVIIISTRRNAPSKCSPLKNSHCSKYIVGPGRHAKF